MVNNAKVQNPSTGDKPIDLGEIKDLEDEINEVINSCKSIIKNNYSVIKKKNNGDKKKDKKDPSKITLETVAQDMSNILENLKGHLGSNKNTQDSFSDLIPKLEELVKSRHLAPSASHSKKEQNAKPNPPGLVAKPLLVKNTNSVNKSNKAEHKNMPHSKSSSASTASKHPSSQVSRQRSNLSKLSVSSKKRNLSNRTSSADRRWGRSQPEISREIYDPLGVIKDEVERAKQAEKTFTIRGTFQGVRRALLNRGWIEKYHFSYRERVNDDMKKFQHCSIQELLDMMRNKEIADVCKRLIKSKLLATHQVDLYWSYDYDGFRECPDKVKLTRMNKLRRDGYSFTSKKGLCDASKKSWFSIPGLANMNHPRTYNLVKNGDTSEFIKDFSLTAAMSLLKWIMKNSVTHECKVISPTGKILLSVFNFALNECYKFIKLSRKEATDFPEVFEHEWNEFLENYYKIIQFGNHFKQVNGVTEGDMVRKSNYILSHLKEHWSYLDMDGIMNIWILKPINGSQGVGIHICRTLKYILGVIKSNPNRRYIVQKYIERPLLIYNTKFDIRQWFLISSSVPLTIWIYKHSYLRFSSQTYSLRKLHESIHLTNNSVQSRYGKYQKDIALPPYNMWDSTQFKNYLSDIGYPNVFNDIIFPGMKQCIAAAVLIHKEKLDRRRNSFELQGADFILTEDFKPWLLEINSSPALHASTPVTARMCPAVLEDVMKVVVDHERNNRADTGAFELIFDERIHASTLKDHCCHVLPPIKPNHAYTHPNHDLNTFVENRPKAPLDTDAAEYIKQIGVGLRKTLTNLLQILKTEKEKRQLKTKPNEPISSNTIITDSRRTLTRKSDPVSGVTSSEGKESQPSRGGKMSNLSSDVNEKDCPESSKHKSVSVEKVSVSTNAEELQMSSNTTLFTIQELTQAIHRSDIILADKSASCVLFVRETVTSTSFERCSSRNCSNNKISSILETDEESCEILICPLETLEMMQNQSITELEESESVIIEDFSSKNMDILKMLSPNVEKNIGKTCTMNDEDKGDINCSNIANEVIEKRPDQPVNVKSDKESLDKTNQEITSNVNVKKLHADKINAMNELYDDNIILKIDENEIHFNKQEEILPIEWIKHIKTEMEISNSSSLLQNHILPHIEHGESFVVEEFSSKDMEMLNMPSAPNAEKIISKTLNKSGDKGSNIICDFAGEATKNSTNQTAAVNSEKGPLSETNLKTTLKGVKKIHADKIIDVNVNDEKIILKTDKNEEHINKQEKILPTESTKVIKTEVEISNTSSLLENSTTTTRNSDEETRFTDDYIIKIIESSLMELPKLDSDAKIELENILSYSKKLQVDKIEDVNELNAKAALKIDEEGKNANTHDKILEKEQIETISIEDEISNNSCLTSEKQPYFNNSNVIASCSLSENTPVLTLEKISNPTEIRHKQTKPKNNISITASKRADSTWRLVTRSLKHIFDTKKKQISHKILKGNNNK